MKRIKITGHWEGNGEIWREETAEERFAREVKNAGFKFKDPPVKKENDKRTTTS